MFDLEVIRVCATERRVRDGLLTMHVRHNGTRCVVSLDGEVDLANANVLEETLLEAMADDDGPVVVDMRDLSFIDSTGIACLVRLLHADGADRLRFVHSSAPAVLRVLQLTGIEGKLTPAEPS
jgi:anti-anti-sigma factor